MTQAGAASNFVVMSDKTKTLRAAIRRLGPTEISQASGVKYSTVYGFMTGANQNLRGDNLAKIEAAIREAENAPVAEEVLSVAIYDIRAAAGAGALVEDGAPSGWQPFRASELNRWRLEDLAVIRVGGDSMWETLHDGDAVLVNRAEQRVVKPGIYVLESDGELLVKRCQRDLETGAVDILSDNPRYPAMRVNTPDKLRVLGRVVWIGRAIG